MPHPDDNPRPSPPLERQVERMLSPFDEFVRSQTISSILLFGCTVTAIVIAQSAWEPGFAHLLHTPLGLFAGERMAGMSLLHWVNDGLMALFFFVLGLEIKRELLAGDLRDRQRALLVVTAASGGMLIPALTFWGLNPSGPATAGWAIPMATDTAFALGAMALLGNRIPHGIFTFLAAFAIVDDLGAVLVIALFYSNDLALDFLGYAVLVLAMLGLANVAGIRRPGIYILLGLLLWLCILHSGVHATVAGVLTAICIPARPKTGARTFARRARAVLRKLEQEGSEAKEVLGDDGHHALVQQVEALAEQASTPLRRWEHRLEVPVGLLVLPVFALTNAAIPLPDASWLTILTEPATLGVILGLVIGKFVGVGLFTWLGIRLGFGRLPGGMLPRHIGGVAMLAGMGFTMSIFISQLGFSYSHTLLLQAKIGILCGSLLAALGGLFWLYWASRAEDDGREKLCR